MMTMGMLCDQWEEREGESLTLFWVVDVEGEEDSK